jgi:hypothetical protein
VSMPNKKWFSPYGISEGWKVEEGQKGAGIDAWKPDATEQATEDRQNQEDEISHQENNYLNSFSN